MNDKDTEKESLTERIERLRAAEKVRREAERAQIQADFEKAQRRGQELREKLDVLRHELQDTLTMTATLARERAASRGATVWDNDATILRALITQGEVLRGVLDLLVDPPPAN